VFQSLTVAKQMYADMAVTSFFAAKVGTFAEESLKKFWATQRPGDEQDIVNGENDD